MSNPLTISPPYPYCSFITNPAIVQTGVNSIRVTWGGVASSYKLSYRETGTLVWTDLAPIPGGGSSYTSGYFTSTNPAQTNPAVYNNAVTALYDITGLDVTKEYDLKLGNVCIDGSEFIADAFWSFPATCAPIVNLLSTEQANGTVKITWDAIAGVTEWVLTIQKDNDDEEISVVLTTNEYVMEAREDGDYLFRVNYKCSTGGAVISSTASAKVCGCVTQA